MKRRRCARILRRQLLTVAGQVGEGGGGKGPGERNGAPMLTACAKVREIPTNAAGRLTRFRTLFSPGGSLAFGRASQRPAVSELAPDGMMAAVVCTLMIATTIVVVAAAVPAPLGRGAGATARTERQARAITSLLVRVGAHPGAGDGVGRRGALTAKPRGGFAIAAAASPARRCEGLSCCPELPLVAAIPAWDSYSGGSQFRAGMVGMESGARSPSASVQST